MEVSALQTRLMKLRCLTSIFTAYSICEEIDRLGMTQTPLMSLGHSQNFYFQTLFACWETTYLLLNYHQSCQQCGLLLQNLPWYWKKCRVLRILVDKILVPVDIAMGVKFCLISSAWNQSLWSRPFRFWFWTVARLGANEQAGSCKGQSPTAEWWPIDKTCPFS